MAYFSHINEKKEKHTVLQAYRERFE